METKQALNAFTALSQETRLAAFRLLIEAGPDGLPAGEISSRLGAQASTMSSHLAQLERSGMIKSWRVQRHIFYAADVDGVKRLLTFLVEDCCHGHPEICEAVGDLTSVLEARCSAKC